ncbi:MAG: hypothetical protein LCH81_03675 [Bacteroidetes bacterium]|nr:hypothetical protein [Bacteroidota bacterium]
MAKKIVHFLQAGNPYGYGYHAGETGVIQEKDFAKLQKLHVVRVASAEEVAAYEGTGTTPEDTAAQKGKGAGKGKESGKGPEAPEE